MSRKTLESNQKSSSKSFGEWLWDTWCVCSVIGIWPRFIEPRLLMVNSLAIPCANLPPDLKDFKILQLSDLHFSADTSSTFLDKISARVKEMAPDLIVFTGDLINFAQLEDQERLKAFLNTFSAPSGCFAIFGNHDYSLNVSINENGDYDVVERTLSPIAKGFSILASSPPLTKHFSPRLKQVSLHPQLSGLFAKTPFKVLHNESITIAVKGAKLNLVGLGEYSAQQLDCERAFAQVDPRWPGVILCHHPDAIPLIEKKPGDLILCGHTHGGQINLPWIWQRFTKLENMEYKSGLHFLPGKKAYINRGLGSALNFRWFAPPEIAVFTLVA